MATSPATRPLTIGIARAVDPLHAPLARNAAERLVFRQMYETLVRVDCNGALAAGVAESWRTDDGGTTWTFRLRADAGFWDGRPVTARAVADAWAAVQDAPALAWVSATGERELRVALPAPTGDARVFSHPALAVVRREAGTVWPIGTGPYRPENGATHSAVTAPGAPDLRLVPVHRTADGPPALEFRVSVAGDARRVPADGDVRRALDAGADVVVSGDATVVEYARALAEYTVTPLPWTRTYALVSFRGRSEPDRVLPSEDERAMLARDAAPLGTRAAALPFDGACLRAGSMPAGVSESRARRRAIAHPRDDALARHLAERLSALVRPQARVPAWLRAALDGATDADAATPDAPARGATEFAAPMTRALDGPALLRSVQLQQDVGYVVALQRGPAACIGEAGDIARVVLGHAADASLGITALVDARDHLIRHDSVGVFAIDGDGTIRFGVGRP